MAVVGCIGIGSHDGYVFEPVADRARALGGELELVQADSTALDGDMDALGAFLKDVARCDIVFVHVHGDVSYFRHWKSLLSVLEAGPVSALLTGCEEDFLKEYRRLFLQSEEDRRTLGALEAVGGDENQLSALIWCMRTFDGLDVEVPAPVLPMAQGVYVPGKGALPLGEGLGDVGRSGRPVVLILFVNTFWTNHNTGAIDALIKKVEERGGEPVAVFLRTYADERTGSIGMSRIVDEHLVRGGRPIVDAVVNTMGFSMTLLSDPGSGEQAAADRFFERLGVPVLQAVNLYGPAKAWRESPFGLSPADIAMSVVNPEFDGQIDTFPYCGTEMARNGGYRQVAIEERCDAIAKTAVGWARLSRVPEAEKRVAILIYMYPPRQDLAGGGYGLDTMQSVAGLLRSMSERGYSLDWVPRDGRELKDRLLGGVTNDDSYMSESRMREASVDVVDGGTYGKWLSELPGKVREAFVKAWGEPVGDVHVLDGNLLLPGIVDGNVFVGFQPDRGKTDVSAYHDPWTAPPHQYLAFYRWLRDVWKADALVHMGTHGTLEWLPGKSAGLSEECLPDAILSGIPNVNPYIIDNPGEGMQSKRRQCAVTTTHMIPAMARSGGYGGMDALEKAVQAYMAARDQSQSGKLGDILSQVLEMASAMEMTKDLGLSDDPSPEEMDGAVDGLYDYILEIKDAMIKDGLHVLGEAPDGELMAETVYMLVRSPNGDEPSLRDAVAGAMGLDMEDLLRDPSGRLPDGRLKGEASDAADAAAYGLILRSQESGFDERATLALCRDEFPEAGPDLARAVSFMCGFVVPALRRTGDEIGYVLKALDGGFVPPGPSGCPGRGRARILPTGRNMYSLDPDGIPWQSSWKTGSEMAERMVRRFVDDNGYCPRSVGVVLWATDTMKTGGDDVSYILRLMGLRPVWDGYGGRVTGLEVIPLEELGRPRVDVTVRISGLFRDTFPNLIAMLDRGASMVAALDEDDDSNCLAAAVRRETAEAIAAGVPADRARREASTRVFGDAPGTYGCGVSELVETGRWETVGDLGAEYVRRGCFAYGKGLAGDAMPERFARRLSSMDATVKNHNTRAVDMLDMDDDMDSLGGFNAAVRSLSGKDPASYMGDSSDTRNLRLRTAAEEARFIFRSKVDNPKWLRGLRRHGFAGAKELSKLFDFTLGWSATSGIIEEWQYDDLAHRFVLDDETRGWIRDENPYAMVDMLKRLDEARERGFWSPDAETLARLKEVYLDFEERIEEMTDGRGSSPVHSVRIPLSTVRIIKPS